MAKKPTKPARAAKARPAKTKQPAVSTRPNLGPAIRQAVEAGQGILRLAPTWVPRSFLMPGRRIKLAPQDLYALGAHRGGIDERWFASTTAAANEGAPPDEGLSYVVAEGRRAFTLRDADHFAYEIEPGDELGDRVLDLQARVHFEKVKLSFLIGGVALRQ